jgi:hypothetical protein
MEISLFGPEDLAGVSLFGDVDPDFGRNRDGQIPFPGRDRYFRIEEKRDKLLPLLWRRPYAGETHPWGPGRETVMDVVGDSMVKRIK